MSRQKEPALSYEEAFNTYFGGVNGGLKCKCGWQAFRVKDCWTHIRKTHNERIKKYAKS